MIDIKYQGFISFLFLVKEKPRKRRTKEKASCASSAYPTSCWLNYHINSQECRGIFFHSFLECCLQLSYYIISCTEINGWSPIQCLHGPIITWWRTSPLCNRTPMMKTKLKPKQTVIANNYINHITKFFSWLIMSHKKSKKQSFLVFVYFRKNWKQEKAQGFRSKRQPPSSSSQLPFKYQRLLQLYIFVQYFFFYGSGERTSRAFRGIQACGWDRHGPERF